MYICEYCLQEIESREGHKRHKKIDEMKVLHLIIEEDYENLMECEWCEELTPIEEMLEI